ncbi:hypothetical protein FGO68_gene13345 [Halteria grandinella]|uniref:Uncharacterized protein n=1 Tax=Halteria grandinella TaxID=5974 RepID=A0A8J8NKH1_HALGN|nr:hypothetical protein FGO68_gene13345 [Halteria grandinella]
MRTQSRVYHKQIIVAKVEKRKAKKIKYLSSTQIQRLHQATRLFALLSSFFYALHKFTMNRQLIKKNCVQFRRHYKNIIEI